MRSRAAIHSGTIFRYLYDRGSLQSQEIAQNGLERTPRNLVVTDADVRVIRDTVYAWQDSVPGGVNQQQPQIMPTPYNPAPLPESSAGATFAAAAVPEKPRRRAKPSNNPGMAHVRPTSGFHEAAHRDSGL